MGMAVAQLQIAGRSRAISRQWVPGVQSPYPAMGGFARDAVLAIGRGPAS